MTTSPTHRGKIMTMKTISLLLFSSVLVAAQSISERLQKGLFEEEAKHNLPAAIEEYKAVIAEADEQRRLTATAVFRLAESYRKLGRTNEAVPLYERVLRDFSDQTQLVQRASARLPERKTEVREPATPVRANYFDALGRLLDNSPDLLNSPATNEPPGKEVVFTFLQWAALKGDIDMIEFLIRRGAQPDRTTQRAPETALMYAVRNGHRRAAERLIKGGAGVNARHGSNTPLNIAASHGYSEVIKLLLESGGNVNLEAAYGWTALHAAASSGQVEAIQLLVKGGAKVEAPAEDSATPLSAAVDNQQARAVTSLLEAGADPNNAGRSGRAPILLAVERNADVFHALAASPNVDVNIRARDGTTPLMRAVERGLISVVETLIKRKANLNSTNSAGDTPLHIATGNSDIRFLETLLEAGADPNIQNEQGLSPLHAVAGAFKKVSKGEGIYTQEPRQPVPTKIAVLLKHKTKPNLRDIEGRTPLHYAVLRRSPQAITILLDAQADPNVRDDYEKTPLDYAGSGANWSALDARTTQLLVNAGGTNSVKPAALPIPGQPFPAPQQPPSTGGTTPRPQ